jgi:hypothetical protein
MDTHLDGVLKVHLPSETHVAVAEADDVLVDGLFSTLSDLR